MIQAIQQVHAYLSMPPKQALAKEVVRSFEQWIDQGAHWPDSYASQNSDEGQHWAFLPLRKIDVPEVDIPSSHPPFVKFIPNRRTVLCDARYIVLSVELIKAD